jgi:multicomponent Na+:H+ antiporter subunit G
MLVDLFSYVAIVAGAFFFLAGTVGLLRFPDTLTRLHALTKADNLGLGLSCWGSSPCGKRRGAQAQAVWLLVLFPARAAPVNTQPRHSAGSDGLISDLRADLGLAVWASSPARFAQSSGSSRTDCC